MLVYAVLGTSASLSVSTTTTLAILTGAELGEVAPGRRSGGAAARLGHADAARRGDPGRGLALRLGFVANFISEPVLIGFKAGIGIVIVLDQIPKLLGIHIPRGTFVQQSARDRRAPSRRRRCRRSPSRVAMIAILVGLERFLPRVPAPLVAVAAGIGGAGAARAEGPRRRARRTHPDGPSARSTLPDFSLAAGLWPGALGIALMSFTETIAAGRAFARSDEPPPRANRELLATGLGNAAGAFLGAMPSGGGTSQTAVNRHAGARTQVAGDRHGGRHARDDVFPRPAASA